MKNHRPVVLCVDDEKTILDSLWDQISPALGNDFMFEIAQSAEEALELIDEYMSEKMELAVVISDQLMPGMKGDQFLMRVHQLLPDTLKILLTGQVSFDSVLNAINKARLYRYIPKPWEKNDLVMTVSEAARSYLQNIQLTEYNKLLRSLNKATQEISSEMELKLLVGRLMKSVIENTGAEQCYFLTEKNGILSIEASGKFNIAQADITYHPENSQDIITKLGHYLEHNSLPKHCTTTPIKKQNRLIGYLVIENAYSQEPISTNQIEVAQMLASQAAISLENVRLYDQLKEEKQKVEVMHKDITDSIQYAKRIQIAIMPPAQSLHERFADAFVYYQPKDIVSGDFYWWSFQQDYTLIAAVDCTGHGVPGCFMSVVAAGLLKQTIEHEKMTRPNEILTAINELLLHTLRKGEQQKNMVMKDGMDICLCAIAKNQRKVLFAGARRPLYRIREGNLETFEADKRSIGEIANPPPFALLEIDLLPNDSLYLFSDGIADQFGGDKNKKLTPKRLRTWLQSMASLPMQEQKIGIEKHISVWQGQNSQTDDMLLIGLRMS